MFIGSVEVYASETVNNSPYDAVPYQTTYRLRLNLAPDMTSVYALFGNAEDLPHVPAAYFNVYADPGGVSPPNSMFGAMFGGDYMLTSFLSLGPDTNDMAPNTGTSGHGIMGWAAGGPLTLGVNPGPTDDFAYFWMDPTLSEETDYSMVGGPLIVQLTVPSDEPFFVKLGLQGKSMNSRSDWQKKTVIWMHSIDGVCPAGMEGEGCLHDVDECANAGCPNGCWNGINEFACL